MDFLAELDKDEEQVAAPVAPAVVEPTKKPVSDTTPAFDFYAGVDEDDAEPGIGLFPTQANDEFKRKAEFERAHEGGPNALTRALRSRNVFGGTVQRMSDWLDAAPGTFDEDPDFVVADHKEKYAHMSIVDREWLLEAGSEQEFEYRLAITKRELDDEAYLANRPDRLGATILSDVFDAETLLEIPLGPYGWATRGVTIGGKLARGAAQGIGTGTAAGVVDMNVHALSGEDELFVRALAGMVGTAASGSLAKTAKKQIEEVQTRAYDDAALAAGDDSVAQSTI
jgi:hypothetical protein